MRGGKRKSSTTRAGTDGETNNPHPQSQATSSAAVGGGGGGTEAEELQLQQSDKGTVNAEKEMENQENELEDDEEDNEDENGGEEEEVRPKLAEGFFEIESVRRKRRRKGQVQYYVKWRGWPDTANTWEPVENLVGVSDVIEAFEESLRGGKHRKRKRKHGGSHSHSKKKQQKRSPAAATTEDVPAVEAQSEEPEAVAFPSLDEVEGHENGVETEKNANGEGVSSPLSNVEGEREKDGMNVSLRELRVTRGTRAAATDGDNGAGKGLVADGEEAAPVTEGEGPQNGADTVRSTGARRRKSGSVKRFKLDSTTSDPTDEQPPALINLSGPSQAAAAADGTEPPPPHVADGRQGGNLALPVGNSSVDEPAQSAIVEIIKPISYSSSLSNNVQDVSVSFLTKRADGNQVMVDNKFLKANYPLLLISFYEQHLRYSPT